LKLFRQLSGLGDTSDTRLGFFRLWERVFLRYENMNSSLRPEVRDYNYYSDGSSIFSNRRDVAFVYTIDGMEREVPIDIRARIRQEAKPGVRVNFISLFERTKIDWSSSRTKSTIRLWSTLNKDMKDVDEFSYNDNVKYLDNNAWRKQSLIYHTGADNRKRRLFKYRTLMLVIGERDVDFDNSIEEILKTRSMKITRVTEGVDRYLRVFSPFSLEYNSSVLKDVGAVELTDELVSRLSSYDHGKIGEFGLYWGVDIESRFPVLKAVKVHSTDAENILITAETGGGKSFLVKMIIMQLLADVRFRGTIMDIEGFEYKTLADFVRNKSSVVVINMAEGQGAYYDPVEICHVSGLSEEQDSDTDMFSFSQSFTLSLFKTLLGDVLKDNNWASIIIDNAVANTYASRGVTSEKSTWRYSTGLTLFDVYENIKQLYDLTMIDDSELHYKYRSNEEYISALDLVVAKLGVYFEKPENGGTRSHLFKKRVKLEEVVNAKLVICSFGMAGKSQDLVDPVQMALAQLSAANISHIRSLFSSKDGLYNFKVWEEFQRWGAFPDSDKTIKTALTGGRKLGDVNLILTNNVKDLLDDDKFAVFGNTTSFAIGAINDQETRDRLIQKLSIPLLKPDLDKIVLTKKNTSRKKDKKSKGKIGNKYDKAFLLRLDRSVATIVKMEVPEYLAESSLLKTGDEATGVA
jgi:hypothetical protein